MSYRNRNSDDDLYFSKDSDFSDYSGYDIYEEFEENNYCYDPDWIEVENSRIFAISADESDADSTQAVSMPKKPANKSKIKSIHKDHRKRVRDKFFKFGLESFTEYEVLEFLLFHSIPMKDTNVTAHQLIDKFGSLKGVLNAEFYDLMEVAGISEVSASLITLQREISKYIRTNNCEGQILKTAAQAGKFCCEYFASHLEETTILIVLDSERTVLAVEVISNGSESETGFYPRRIIKKIIRHRGTKIMLSHNHPDLNPTPSSNDIYNTNVLAAALKEFGVEVIDHIVCGGTKYTSMSDNGFLTY